MIGASLHQYQSTASIGAGRMGAGVSLAGHAARWRQRIVPGSSRAIRRACLPYAFPAFVCGSIAPGVIRFAP